jgi:hypothetical protein
MAPAVLMLTMAGKQVMPEGIANLIKNGEASSNKRHRRCSQTSTRLGRSETGRIITRNLGLSPTGTESSRWSSPTGKALHFTMTMKLTFTKGVPWLSEM